MTNVCEELFQARQQLNQLLKDVEELNKFCHSGCSPDEENCSTKCSNEIHNRINMANEKIEHLKVKSMILDKLCNKSHIRGNE